MKNHIPKGFTLIELLLVVAVIATLSVIIILTLNPAEILRQTRDASRVSDLNAVKSGILLFLSDVATSSSALGIPRVCYYYATGFTTTTCTSWFPTATVGTVASTSRQINGTGWIPVNLNAISSGAPFGTWPIDPVNNVNYFYSYTANATSGFKLAAKMESVKYSASGSRDVVSTDGGVDNATFESGTVPDL